jgi:sugar-specific transcriptional regulator TrmB
MILLDIVYSVSIVLTTMVDNNIIPEFMKLGLSEYEARAYLSILHNNPVTAYETGKASGIPTSKVYEVLKKLVIKGIVSIAEEGRTRQYIPLAPDEFLDKHKKMTERIIDSLRVELSRIQEKQVFSHIWNINDYNYLMDKVKHAIEGASRTILLSLWKEEMALIEEHLRNALGKGVKVVIVHFGSPKVKIGQMYPHPIEDTIYQEKEGRGFIAVIDSREILSGAIFQNLMVEGAWSMNRGFVTLAEDYIKHDIYIMKIMKRFDRTLKERFGVKYAKLRDIFTDEEIRT